ncbi:hypothetical protein KEM55_002340, partial [Ascosphaera atra]
MAPSDTSTLAPPDPNAAPSSTYEENDHRHSIDSRGDSVASASAASTSLHRHLTSATQRSRLSRTRTNASIRSEHRGYAAAFPDSASAYQNDTSSDEEAEEEYEDALVEEEEREGLESPAAGGAGGDADLEKGALEREKTRESLKMQRTRSSRKSREKDPKLVTWNGPDDPENPKNWTSKKKWAAVITVSCFTFISPVSSSLVAPALETMAADFGITNQVQTELMMSVFVLAYAIGPLFLGPLSELFGRVIVLQLANLFYLAFNIGCGFAQNNGQMCAFRFLAGLGGSAPLA